jgi:transcriptional regulator NrdR family protein
MDTQVLKRDGSVENFEPEKIARVVEAAGLEEDEAEDLAARVEKWVIESKKEEISSQEIRDKVIEELQDVDEYAANMYTWYQKTKDNNHYDDPTLDD